MLPKKVHATWAMLAAMATSMGLFEFSPAKLTRRSINQTKPITITWWSWTSNPQNVIKAFEAAHPGVRIVHPTIGGPQRNTLNWQRLWLLTQEHPMSCKSPMIPRLNSWPQER